MDDKENLFFSTAEGVDVKAIYTEEGLLILKGSKFPYGNIKEAKKYQEGFIKKRHDLLISGNLIREGDYCIFPRDFLCRLGLAVNVIFLRNRTDKWTGFKRADGTPLHAVLKKVRDVDDEEEEEETTISEDTEPLRLDLHGNFTEWGTEVFSQQAFREFCETVKEDGSRLHLILDEALIIYSNYTPSEVRLYSPSDDNNRRRYFKLPFLVLPVLGDPEYLMDGDDVRWNVIASTGGKSADVCSILPANVTMENFSPQNLVCLQNFSRLKGDVSIGMHNNYYYISPNKLKEILHQHLDEIIECVAQCKVKSDWGKSAQTLEELKELAKQYLDHEYLFYDNGNKDEGKERVKVLRQEVIDNIAKVTSERPDDSLKDEYVDYNGDEDDWWSEGSYDETVLNIVTAPSENFLLPVSLFDALEPYELEKVDFWALNSYFEAEVMTSWEVSKGWFRTNDSDGYDYIPN